MNYKELDQTLRPWIPSDVLMTSTLVVLFVLLSPNFQFSPPMTVRAIVARKPVSTLLTAFLLAAMSRKPALAIAVAVAIFYGSELLSWLENVTVETFVSPLPAASSSHPSVPAVTMPVTELKRWKSLDALGMSGLVDDDYMYRFPFHVLAV